jgi:hypothetical protein
MVAMPFQGVDFAWQEFPSVTLPIKSFVKKLLMFSPPYPGSYHEIDRVNSTSIVTHETEIRILLWGLKNQKKIVTPGNYKKSRLDE